MRDAHRATSEGLEGKPPPFASISSPPTSVDVQRTPPKELQRSPNEGLGGCTTPAVGAVAICLFGLFRGTKKSMPQYRRNVYEPLLAHYGSIDVFVHAMVQEKVSAHARGQEARPRRLPNVLTEIGQLAPCRYTAEDQATVDEKLTRHLPRRMHNYDASQIRNLYRAKYSLSAVADILVAYERQAKQRYRTVLVVRPDTLVLTPVVPLPPSAAEVAEHGIVVPEFMTWGGVNDRFALGSRGPMVTTYMRQYDLAYTRREVLRGKGRYAINTEGVLCKLLADANVTTASARMCIVRVRTNNDCNKLDRQLLARDQSRDAAMCQGLSHTFESMPQPACNELEMSICK